MLGHNETQLDSYNKNKPNAHGTAYPTQAPLSLTGLRSGCIATTRDRVGQWPKLICPSSTTPCSPAKQLKTSAWRTTPSTASWATPTTPSPKQKTTSTLSTTQLREGTQQGRLVASHREEAPAARAHGTWALRQYLKEVRL